MQNLTLFTALSFAAFLLLILVFELSHAMLGRWLGIRVIRVSIGYDPFDKYLIAWQGRHWEWRIGILPFGGYTKFRGAEDEPVDVDEFRDDEDITPGLDCRPSPPTDSFQAAGRLARIGVILAGPLSQIVLAIILLAVPVTQRTEQLQYAPRQIGQLEPSAVPGLQITQNAATWEGQWELCSDITTQAIRRYVLFQPLDGWGGFCGWLITGGAAGARSISMWLSFIGLIALLNGVFNLLPFGGLNGSHVIRVLLEMVVDADVAERSYTRYTILTILFLFAVQIRIIYADVIWILGQ
ncbi:hypothetical protein GYB59_06070 [bacterium]|nr:hypothetical protein [bacterium]